MLMSVKNQSNTWGKCRERGESQILISLVCIDSFNELYAFQRHRGAKESRFDSCGHSVLHIPSLDSWWDSLQGHQPAVGWGRQSKG